MLRVINSTTNDGMWEYKESITKIIIQKEIKPIENAILEYDESTKKDKSIMSYIVENESAPSTYTAYLQRNKELFLNPNSSFLFMNLENLENIEGLETINTSKVTNMSFMFNNCYKLNTLNLSRFNTSNVENMSGMFWNCKQLSNLDILHFNTEQVTNMSYMFSSCNNISNPLILHE